MRQLEGVEATDPMFNHLVDKPIHDVRHHIEEESKLLPRLAELRELAAKVLRAKKIAPARRVQRPRPLGLVRWAMLAVSLRPPGYG